MRKNLIVCGYLPEHHYFYNLIETSNKINLVGILDSYNELALKNAYNNNVSCFNSLDEILENFGKIDLAYIPKASFIASEDNRLSISLLERQISVLDENSCNSELLIENLRKANQKNEFYYAYRHIIDTVFFNRMIGIIKDLSRKMEIILIDATFEQKNLILISRIICDSLKINTTIKVKNNDVYSYYYLITGEIGSYDYIFKIYNIDNRSMYNNQKHINALTLITNEGSLTIDLTFKNICWHGNNLKPSKTILKNHEISDCESKVLDNFISKRIIQRDVQAILNDAVKIKEIDGLLSGGGKKNNAKQLKGKIKTSVHLSLYNQITSSDTGSAIDRDLKTIKSNIYKKYLYYKNDFLDDYFQSMNNYVGMEIMLFLNSKNIFNKPYKKYNCNEIMNKVTSRKTKRNESIIKLWLSQLSNTGFINSDYDNYYWASNVVLKTERDRIYDHLSFLWNWKLGNPLSLKYLKKNIKEMDKLFNGEINCNEILFPQGKIDYAEALYKENTIYKMLNELLALKVAEYILGNCEEDRLSVLEVGAGIGATTSAIFTMLEKMNLQRRCEYIYSDISDFFLQIGREKFTGVSDINYKKIDLNNYRQLKILPQADIIVAAGVLNNVKDVDITLELLYKKIKPKGLLLITEPVGNQIEMLVSQVFMMESILKNDEDDNNLFASEVLWIEKLKKTGFNNIESFPSDSHKYKEFGQRLFVAEK